MTSQHSYIACVRESTQNLPNIDSVRPFSSADDACLKDLSDVLTKHGATFRFGISLLHSHFEMSDDEILLEETDIENRRQTLSVVKKADVPAGAIYMDRRFDIADKQRVVALFGKMSGYRSGLLVKKLESDLALSPQNAEALFEDVKRFIALCTNTSSPIAPPRIVDQGWHQFILLTKDYSKFCNDYCGRYIHHQPADPFAKAKDFGAERRRTRELAEAVFGKLSSNWNESLTAANCTHNCGTGECDSAQPEQLTKEPSSLYL